MPIGKFGREGWLFFSDHSPNNFSSHDSASFHRPSDDRLTGIMFGILKVGKAGLAIAWYEHLSEDAKAAYVLCLSEKILVLTRSYPWHQLIRNMMDMCWEWVEGKKYGADDLYYQFDDEEDGLIFIEGEKEVAESPQFMLILHTILEAICYIMWQAYKYEKKDYLPQILDLVSDESIEMDFMAKIKRIHGYQEEWSEHLKEYLLKNYPARSDKQIKREELLKLIS
jgi:hypothetical protein